MQKAILKGIRQFIVVIAIMSFMLASISYVGIAYAEGGVGTGSNVQTGDSGSSGSSGTGTGGGTGAVELFPLPGASMYGNLPAPTQATAQGRFQELMWGIVQNVRYVLGAVAIAFIVYSGFRMVTGWGNEEVYGKQRTNLLYAVIGLAIVGMSGEMARIFSVSCPDYTAPGITKYACTPGGFLSNPNAIIRSSTIFNQQTQIIITFIKYFIGGVAVLEIVTSGLQMVTMGGTEEKMVRAKKNLTYGLLGLGLIIFADTAISQVFYKIDPTRYPSVGGAKPGIDAARGVREIVGFTNFVVSIVGPIAVLMLLAGGIMYITAAGKDEQMNKAKKLIVVALVGILIIYGAFAIVSTFISGSFGEPDATLGTQAVSFLPSS